MSLKINKQINQIKNILKNDIEQTLSIYDEKIKRRENYINEYTFTHTNIILCIKILQEKFILAEEYLKKDSNYYNLIRKEDDQKFEDIVLQAYKDAIKECNFIFKDIDSINEYIEILPSGYAIIKILDILETITCWNEDDFLGWAYQFYNDEIRENTLNKNDLNYISLNSQFYTPKWIINYLIENTLLKYIQENKNMSLENIKIYDPTCGSGHFLIRTYEYLKEIYLENGYSLNETIKNIVEKNLYGFDIDERAVQIANLIIKIKTFEDGYTEDITPNILSPNKIKNKKLKLLGSLYTGKSLSILNQKYDIILSNPPYTDSSEYSDELKYLIKNNYAKFKKNLYSCYIAKNIEMVKNNGYIGMITPQTFMFISSYKDTRDLIIKNTHIDKFVHFGLGGVFDYALVDTAMYILKKSKNDNSQSKFIKLTDVQNKKDALKKEDLYSYMISQSDFKQIPTLSFVYWISNKFRNIFKFKPLKNICDIRQGVATGNNKKFLRYNWEIANSNDKWVNYVKGGPHKKWYGNLWWLISYDENSYRELKLNGNHLPNEKYYFKEGITYSMTTSKGSTFRYLPKGNIFDCKGSSLFFKNEEDIFVFLALLNSKLSSYLYKFIAGSVDLEVGDLKNLPISPQLLKNNEIREKLILLSKINILIMKQNTEHIPIESHYDDKYDLNLKNDVYEELSTFINKKNILDSYMALSESLIDEIIFESYNLDEKDLQNIYSSEGFSYIKYPVIDNFKLPKFKNYINKKYLNEFKIHEDDLEKLEDLIHKNIKYENKNFSKDIIIKNYEKKFRSDYINSIKYSAIKSKTNPINVYNIICKNQKKLSKKSFEIKNLLSLEINKLIIKYLKSLNFGFCSIEKNTKDIDSIEKYIISKTSLNNDLFIDIFEKNLVNYLKTDFMVFHKKLYKKRPLIIPIGNKNLDITIFLYYFSFEKNTLSMINKIYINESIEKLKNKVSITKKEEELISQYNEFKKNIEKIKIDNINFDDGIEKNIQKINTITINI